MWVNETGYANNWGGETGGETQRKGEKFLLRKKTALMLYQDIYCLNTLFGYYLAQLFSIYVTLDHKTILKVAGVYL